MSMHLKERLHLPRELTDLCDNSSIAVTIADPQGRDMPLIYANPAFEALTGWQRGGALGKNCRFLQGPDTDRTVTDELADTCLKLESNAACLINYKADGTRFLNLLAIKKLHDPQHQNYLMACQMAFSILNGRACDIADTSRIDRAWRQLRRGNRLGPMELNPNDIYRLDAISMRFESTFIRARNTLIRRATAYTQRKMDIDWSRAHGQRQDSALLGA